MSEETEVVGDEEFKAHIQEMMASVEEGDAIKDFIQGRLGRLISARIDEMRAGLMEKLAVADPFNTSMISRLQSRIHAYDTFWSILIEAMHKADQTAKDLSAFEAPPEG